MNVPSSYGFEGHTASISNDERQRETRRSWRRVETRVPTVVDTNGGRQTPMPDDLEPRWARRSVEGGLTRVVNSKYR